MDEIWGVEVNTTHGHKTYHAAVESEAAAAREILKINEDESPQIEGIGLTENIFHLKPGTCRQVLP